MGLFGRGKNKAQKQREATLARINGKAIKYVTRREVDDAGTAVETVLGKAGRINCLDTDIVVMCDGKEVFRCASEDATCSELLSLDGAVIQGVNRLTGGEDTVVAYYQYYR
jgi:hypothetical protein